MRCQLSERGQWIPARCPARGPLPAAAQPSLWERPFLEEPSAPSPGGVGTSELPGGQHWPGTGRRAGGLVVPGKGIRGGHNMYRGHCPGLCDPPRDTSCPAGRVDTEVWTVPTLRMAREEPKRTLTTNLAGVARCCLVHAHRLRHLPLYRQATPTAPISHTGGTEARPVPRPALPVSPCWLCVSPGGPTFLI